MKSRMGRIIFSAVSLLAESMPSGMPTIMIRIWAVSTSASVCRKGVHRPMFSTRKRPRSANRPVRQPASQNARSDRTTMTTMEGEPCSTARRASMIVSVTSAKPSKNAPRYVCRKSTNASTQSLRGMRKSNTGGLLGSGICLGVGGGQRRQDRALHDHAAKALPVVNHGHRSRRLAGDSDEVLERRLLGNRDDLVHAGHLQALLGGAGALQLLDQVLGGQVALHLALRVDHENAGEPGTAQLGEDGARAVPHVGGFLHRLHDAAGRQHTGAVDTLDEGLYVIVA